MAIGGGLDRAGVAGSIECANCGESNPDTKAFCGPCGTNLEHEGNDQAAKLDPPGARDEGATKHAGRSVRQAGFSQRGGSG